jgi:hypothetical protein
MATILVGSQLSSLNATCAPGTLLHLEQGIHEYLPASVRIGQEEFDPAQVRFASPGIGLVGAIPLSAHNRIVEALQNSGARLGYRRDGLGGSFSDCYPQPVLETSLFIRTSI